MRSVRFYFDPYGVKPCSMKRYYAWALNDLCTPPAYFIAMGTAQYSNLIQTHSVETHCNNHNIYKLARPT